MTTAFVLWGGGSLGAAQVGMLRALADAGVEADVVVGSSVGAINGTYYAAHPTADGVEELAQLWLSLGRHDVFPLGPGGALRALVEDLPWAPLRGLTRALGVANHTFPLNPVTMLSALAGRNNHFIDSARFQQFLQRMLPVERLEDTRLPLEVMTTEVCSGQAIPIATGPALPAVMASSAIPAIYPNVEFDGRLLMDGEVADRTCLDRAVELGADEIYLLTAGFSRNLTHPPSSALAMAVHAYNLLSEQRLSAALARIGTDVRVHRPPTLHTTQVLPIDFGHTAELIDQATESTRYWLHGHLPEDAAPVDVDVRPQAS